MFLNIITGIALVFAALISAGTGWLLAEVTRRHVANGR